MEYFGDGSWPSCGVGWVGATIGVGEMVEQLAEVEVVEELV